MIYFLSVYIDQWKNKNVLLFLPDPRFVGAYIVPENDNPEDDKVYFFFRENAIDGEHTGKATHARIGQLCKVNTKYKQICE